MLLILAATTALTACGDAEPATNAGSTPPASTSAATSAAASPTAAPASPAAAGATSDKEICTSLKNASDEMKAELLKVAMAGEPSAADLKKILTELGTKVTALTAAGGDGKVATALKPFGAEAAKAAAAADPGSAADNPAFLKAGKDVSAACKAAGVSVTL